MDLYIRKVRIVLKNFTSIAFEGDKPIKRYSNSKHAISLLLPFNRILGTGKSRLTTSGEYGRFDAQFM